MVDTLSYFAAHAHGYVVPLALELNWTSLFLSHRELIENVFSTGMQTVWAVGTAEQIQDIPTDLSAGYLTFGGDVYGNATHSPQVYEAFDHS